jgi:transposase InsO family protein
LTADLVTDALTMGRFRKRPTPGLIHHSDRGSPYAIIVFQHMLREYGMICSMSRKGNCWDNSPTESGFNSFKNERVHGIRYAIHTQIKAAAFEYIEVFYSQGIVSSPRAACARTLRKQRAANSRFLCHVKFFCIFSKIFYGAGMSLASAADRECLNFS